MTTRTAPAALEIRVLPWRPRPRVMDPEIVRGADFTYGADDLISGLVGIGLTLVCLVAAPLVAVLLAIVLLPLEIWLVAVLAVLYLLARFAGVIPWTVLHVSDGVQVRERYRFFPTALRRARALNGGGAPQVLWLWR